MLCKSESVDGLENVLVNAFSNFTQGLSLTTALDVIVSVEERRLSRTGCHCVV